MIRRTVAHVSTGCGGRGERRVRRALIFFTLHRSHATLTRDRCSPGRCAGACCPSPCLGMIMNMMAAGSKLGCTKCRGAVGLWFTSGASFECCGDPPLKLIPTSNTQQRSRRRQTRYIHPTTNLNIKAGVVLKSGDVIYIYVMDLVYCARDHKIRAELFTTEF